MGKLRFQGLSDKLQGHCIVRLGSPTLTVSVILQTSLIGLGRDTAVVSEARGGGEDIIEECKGIRPGKQQTPSVPKGGPGA